VLGGHLLQFIRRVTARSHTTEFWKDGELFVWLTAVGVALTLLLAGGMLGLIMVLGLGEFWPADVLKVRLNNGQEVIGQLINKEVIPHSTDPMHPLGRSRLRLRVGNRDIFGSDFRWINADDIASQTTPADLAVLERREWGRMYGRVTTLHDADLVMAEGPTVWDTLSRLLDESNRLDAQIRRVERTQIGELNAQLESIRLQRRSLVSQDRSLEDKVARLEIEYQRVTETLDALRHQATRYSLTVALSNGREVRLPLAQVIQVLRPNDMSWTSKLGTYLSNFWTFLSGEPREANTEGGIFPAIFGTVMMVLIMTIVVMPFGVMAAVYLREYAKQGILVRLVRIAVNNLAGVPSIVFGVFGLGFFVYAVGGTIDQLFFGDALPNPTFGTGGILWASLTLALLTVPVVIVATEEGLSAVPREFREGSLGLGGTKFQTLWHVILPCALPGILTGLILAMARAAGEVAPLMLTGVVKLAPSLPVDGEFPFLHLDRKFMHLGFHIYDVGFQSPNVEAAKPMVYMTTLTLIAVVVSLNLLAVVIRNRVRKRYAASAV
jgi:phosphate transport system permease protein